MWINTYTRSELIPESRLSSENNEHSNSVPNDSGCCEDDIVDDCNEENNTPPLTDGIPFFFCFLSVSWVSCNRPSTSAYRSFRSVSSIANSFCVSRVTTRRAVNSSFSFLHWKKENEKFYNWYYVKYEIITHTYIYLLHSVVKHFVHIDKPATSLPS